MWGNEDIASARRFCDSDSPDLLRDPLDCVFSVSPEDLLESLPSYDERRRILATDSLASVEGFRVMVQLTFKYLFGLSFCSHCPDCVSSADPCQDLFGSSANAEGGIFGRIDAIFTSIEAQKSTGSLHAHSQLVVQCLHQHTPLWEIVTQLKKGAGSMFNAYLNYKAHVCRQVYASDRDVVDEKLNTFESQWPEYETATNLFGCPSYLRDVPYDPTSNVSDEGVREMQEEGKAWLRKHLREDVE